MGKIPKMAARGLPIFSVLLWLFSQAFDYSGLIHHTEFLYTAAYSYKYCRLYSYPFTYSIFVRELSKPLTSGMVYYVNSTVETVNFWNFLKR
jgi:hypothetical protein